MMQIKGFLFDNDGVILNTEAALVEINTQLLKSHGVVFDPNTRKHFSGKPDIPGLKVLIDVHGLNGKVTPEQLSAQRKSVLDNWYKNAKFVPGFVEYYNDLRKEFPEVAVGVASGTDPERYNLADAKLGLRSMFNHKVCLSRDAEVRHKPEPDIFVYAAGVIGAPVKKCAIWEDSPLGLASAYNAGIRKLISYTGTLSKEDLIEATENLLNKKLEDGEILFIDDFGEEALQRTIEYLRVN